MERLTECGERWGYCEEKERKGETRRLLPSRHYGRVLPQGTPKVGEETRDGRKEKMERQEKDSKEGGDGEK